jgi:hypothetical protein
MTQQHRGGQRTGGETQNENGSETATHDGIVLASA